MANYKQKKEEGIIKLYVRDIEWQVEIGRSNPEFLQLMKDKGNRFRDEILFRLEADYEEEKDYDEIPDTMSFDEWLKDNDIDVLGEVQKSIKKYYVECVLGLPKEVVIDYELSVGETSSDLSNADVVSVLDRQFGYKVSNTNDIHFARAKGTDIAKQNIKDGIDKVMKEESFKNFLELTTSFKNYSFRNKMLVFSQCPNATMVKGASAWKDDFERYINKGEKAIWIYVPFNRTFKDEEKLIEYINEKNRIVGLSSDFFISKAEEERLLATLKEKGSVTLMTGFNVAPVYDVSQTNGKELDIEFVKNINQDLADFENIKNALVTVSEQNKVPVEFVSKQNNPKLQQAYGYFDVAMNEIVISITDRSEQDQIKTLVHEMAHSMLHGNSMKVLGITSTAELDKSMREVEAEAVAYMVCKEFGIDSGCRSFGYIAEYLPLDKDERNRAFEQSFKRIEECAKQISREVEKIYDFKKALEDTEIQQSMEMEERE